MAEAAGDRLQPFEHILVQWTLENFSFSSTRTYSLRSLEFNLQAAVPSTWFLVAEWTKVHEDLLLKGPILNIHLKRKWKESQTKEDIRGSVRLGCKNIRGQRKWVAHIFDGMLNIGNVYSVFGDINPGTITPERFVLLCEIILYNDSEHMQSENSLDIFKDPSRALKHAIYKPDGEFLPDVFLYVGLPQGVTIYVDEKKRGVTAKKSMVQRSPFLSELVQGDSPDGIYTNPEIQNIPLKAVEQWVYYLHLGRFDFHNKVHLSFSLFELAKQMRNVELTPLLKESRVLDIVSEAGGGSGEFHTTLNNQALKQKKKVSSTAVYTDFSKKVKCQIDFFPTQGYIGFLTCLSTDDLRLDATFRIYALEQDSDKIGYKKWFSFSFDSTEKKLLYGTFIPTDRACNFLGAPENQPMHIKFIVSHSDLKFKNRMKNTELYKATTMKNIPEATASADLKIKPDLTIQAKDKKFDVHRAVIGANSITFHLKMPDIMGNHADFSKIDSDIMHAMLEFMYTGKLNLNSLATAYKVYKITEKLIRIYYLHEICEDFILSSINLHTAREIYTNQPYFQPECLKYLVCNCRKIYNTENWREILAIPNLVKAVESGMWSQEKLATSFSRKSST